MKYSPYLCQTKQNDMARFRDNKDLRQFVKSDNVIKTGKNEYRTQCSQYSIPMTLQGLCKYAKLQYGVL